MNASARPLFDAVKARGGRACLFAQEIDTLTNTLGNEWGKFDDFLRQAHHHEGYQYLRSGGEVHIQRPAVSVVLTGTEAQFERLIPDVENGLLSRFCLYYFDDEPVWRSQRPDPRAGAFDHALEMASTRLFALYSALCRREKPLYIDMQAAGWDMHDQRCGALLEVAKTEGMGHLASVVKRAGVAAFRLSMLLAVLRLPSAENVASVEVSLPDVALGLDIALEWARHTLTWASRLQSSGRVFLNEKQLRLLGSLPDKFETAQAVSAGNKLEIPQRTVKDWLGRWKVHPAGPVIWLQQGYYCKRL